MAEKTKASGDNEATIAKGDEAAKDLGADEVAEKIEAENEQGFRGTKADPTPNSAYTVAGVTSGEATPETDEKARAEANRALGR